MGSAAAARGARGALDGPRRHRPQRRQGRRAHVGDLIVLRHAASREHAFDELSQRLKASEEAGKQGFVAEAYKIIKECAPGKISELKDRGFGRNKVRALRDAVVDARAVVAAVCGEEADRVGE